MSLFKGESPNLGAVSTVNEPVLSLDVKPQTIEVLVGGPYAAASATGEWLLIGAPTACQVVGVRANFTVTSSSGTLAVRKITADAIAPDASAGATCIELLSGTMSLAGTANTKVAGALSATASALQLAVGDRIGLKLAGTLTGLVGLVVEVDLIKI
jgi:hypothetical protein